MAKAAQKSTGLVHVYSTLANSQKFVRYRDNRDQVNDLPVAEVEVLIKGGAGMASKHLITPMGVHTQITSEQYEAIKDLEHFRNFVDRGFITVEARKASEIEAIVGDMNAKDPGGPITPVDYAAAKKDGTEVVPMDMVEK